MKEKNKATGKLSTREFRKQQRENKWLAEKRKLEQEGWKEVPGFPNYMVNRAGSIVSKSGRTLIPGVNKLSKNMEVFLSNVTRRERKWISVHRIVWEAYKGAIPAGHQILHRDLNNGNNDIENLLICPVKDKFKVLKSLGYNADALCERAKTKGTVVVMFNEKGGIEKIYNKVSDAVADGYKRNSINLCLNGKQKEHMGKTFKRMKLEGSEKVSEHGYGE